MSPEAFPGFVGVLEWNESEPDVILATTAHEVRIEALTFLLTRDPDGTYHLAFDYDDDLTTFVTDYPPPRDLADVRALKDWHEALRGATTQPILSIFGPQSDPVEGIYAWTRVAGEPAPCGQRIPRPRSMPPIDRSQ